jgi:hypothetical protein
LAHRFSNPRVYRIRVCERCQRQADSGTVGDTCPASGCEGALTELEVVPLEQARRWRLERNPADEKVERLHAELVDPFGIGGRSEA